tara:strand:- start:317 stop:1132 length:816 start_codon:yes stop_codon:yes gene_type:complete
MKIKKNKRSEAHPLAGLRFLVTRRDNKESSLTKILKSKGASVIVVPMVKIESPASWDLFDNTLYKVDKIDWAVFTSINGVEQCIKRINKLNQLPSKIFSKIKIACVGQSTAKILVKNGIFPDVVPKKFQTEGLISELKKNELKGKTFWLIQAESPRKFLINELTKQNSNIIFTPVYKSIPILKNYEFLIDLLKKSKLDWVLFGSPSAVKNFKNILPKDFWFTLPNIPKIGCIGQITAEAVRGFGWDVNAKPNVQDFENLVEKICEINLKPI